MTLTTNDKKVISSLQQKKFRDQYGQYIIEGFKMISECIAKEQHLLMILIKGSVAGDERAKEIMRLAAQQSIQLEVVKDNEFDKFSSLETPPGVLAVVKKKDDSIEADKPYLILDAIKDPGNLGTIIRTADWFGINNIVIGKNSVDLYNPKVVQATMGSIFEMNIIENQDLVTFIETLHTRHYQIVATSLQGQDIKDISVPEKRIAILIGNETTGLDPKLVELAQYVYKIPGNSKVESLNVGIAAAITLFKFSPYWQ